MNEKNCFYHQEKDSKAEFKKTTENVGESLAKFGSNLPKKMIEQLKQLEELLD